MRVQSLSLSEEILRRVRAHGQGQWVCSPKDFLDLGSRAAVDQSLARLTKDGKLRRIDRGLYDWPRYSTVLNRPAPASLGLIVATIARRDGIKVAPDGIVAANQLGLTTAVPAKASYITDGDSRLLKIDGATIQFRHAKPSLINWLNRPAGQVVLALDWLGAGAANDSKTIEILRQRLPDHVKQDLLKGIRHLPGWMTQLVKTIASSADSPVLGSPV